MKRLNTILLGLFLAMAVFSSCKKDENQSADLKNELIKKTVAPLIVGEKIEFAYGMGSLNGKLNNVKVVANIAGATGTLWEPFTWKTVNAVNISTLVAKDCITNGSTSTAVMIDTNAATLRYFYVIPEEARGKTLSFDFSVDNKSGQTANVKSPAYQVSNMTMKRSITLVGTSAGARYFSIADMKAYTQAEVDAGNLSGKIDFVYAYAATIAPNGTAYAYGHSLVSPTAITYMPSDLVIKSTWTKNSTKMEKKIGTAVYDGQLKGDVNSNIYVDDLDLQQQSFDGSSDYAISLAADGSIFMKTADGKYTAYVYVNSVTNASSTAVISLKRLQNF